MWCCSRRAMALVGVDEAELEEGLVLDGRAPGVESNGWRARRLAAARRKAGGGNQSPLGGEVQAQVVACRQAVLGPDDRMLTARL